MPSYLGKTYGEAGCLGSGSFGAVVRVFDEDSGVELAAKIFDGPEDSESEEEPRGDAPHDAASITSDALLELSFMSLLTAAGAPNIVQLHDFAFELSSQRGLVAIMQLYARDVGRAIDSADLRVSQRLAIARDLFTALAYLHGRSPALVHRDVKPENILLDAANVAALTDLSFMCFVEESEAASQQGARLAPSAGAPSVLAAKPCRDVVGTPTYIAPEVFLGAAPLPAIDCWSAGVVLLELFQHQRLPVDRDKAALRLVRQARDVMSDKPVPRLVRALLAEEPHARLDALSALAGFVAQLAPQGRASVPSSTLASNGSVALKPAITPSALGVDRSISALCRRLRAKAQQTQLAAQYYASLQPSADPRLLCIVAFKVYERAGDAASDRDLLARTRVKDPPKGKASQATGAEGARALAALAEAQEQLITAMHGCLLVPLASEARRWQVRAGASCTKISSSAKHGEDS